VHRHFHEADAAVVESLNQLRQVPVIQLTDYRYSSGLIQVFTGCFHHDRFLSFISWILMSPRRLSSLLCSKAISRIPASSFLSNPIRELQIRKASMKLSRP